MLELAVATNRGYQDPPVSFEHSDHFSDLHSESLTDIGILGRAAAVCSPAERAAVNLRAAKQTVRFNGRFDGVKTGATAATPVLAAA